MFKFLSHLLDGGCTIVVGSEGGVVNGDMVGGVTVEGGNEFYLEFAIYPLTSDSEDSTNTSLTSNHFNHSRL